MPDYRLKRVLNPNAEVGESPAWRVSDQSLYWIDIHGSTVNRFHPESGEHKVWPVPSTPGCLVFREGEGAIIPSRDGIYDFDFETGEARLILDPPYDPKVHRFNDGKCDRQGRLWVGTMPVELSEIGHRASALFRFDGQTIAAQVSIDIANGLAFSADGRTMYRAETKRREIFAYDVDGASGTVSGERLFATIPPGQGAPDGATVDTDGGYWVALAAGEPTGAIARFKPSGELDFKIETGFPAPAMVNFGGPDMTTLYITSSQFPWLADRPGAELSGSIFTIETDFQGVAEPFFAPVKAN